MRTWLHDVRHAWRTLAKNPGFAAVAVLTLAGDGRPEQIQVANVTHDFFAVLGVDPLLGRSFTAEDGAPIPPPNQRPEDFRPAPAPLLLSHDFWQRCFAGDPGVVGRTLSVNGNPMTVVGVMGPEFRLLVPPNAGMPGDIDAWLPFRFDLAQAPRDNQWLRVVARLAPGVGVEAAQEELDALAARLRDQLQFHRNMGMQMDVVPMHADVVEPVRPILWTLFGAVASCCSSPAPTWPT